MTFGMKIQSDGDGSDEFSIKSMCGCRVVFGSVPISDFAMLTHGFSKAAALDAHLADLIGASFVIGEPENLKELRKRDLPISGKRQRDSELAQRRGLTEVAQWLLKGERGASSNAMCKHIFSVSIEGGNDHPHDPDDLRLCIDFLNATNSRKELDRMRSVSTQWDRLVDVWDNLVSMLSDEMQNAKTAPRTYALMSAAIQ